MRRAGVRSSEMPASVRVVVVVLAVVAVVTAAASTATADVAFQPWVVGPFAIMLTVAAGMILRFTFRRQAMALEPFEAAMIPALVALPGCIVVALATIAHALANTYRRNHPVKAAFNIAQWATVTGVSSLMFGALNGGMTFGERGIGALLFAVLAGAVTNVVSLTLVMHLAERQPVREIVRSIVPALAMGWTINTAFGLLLLFAYRGHPWAVLLFVVPLALLHWAYKGYATALADRTRLRAMHDAVRTIAAPMDPREALPRFLAQVRACFSATAVELALAHDGGRVVHHVDEDGHTSRLEVGEIRSLVGALMREPRAVRLTAGARDAEPLTGIMQHEGWNTCLGAPILSDACIAGTICVYEPSGPQGWEEGELAVLQALANEAGAALRKGELLGEIVEERAKLAQIIDQTSDGIFAIDPMGRVVVWNPALEGMTGFTASVMTSIQRLDVLHPRSEDGAPVRIDHWVQDGELPAAFQITTASAAARILSCSYSRVMDQDLRPSLLIAVVRDVTEARETERLKDDFVATVSHELRTPLTPILGWTETMLARGDAMTPAEHREALRAINRQAKHLEQLIVNLLEVSKIERAGAAARDDAVGVEGLVEAVVRNFQASEPARPFDVTTGDPCIARGDPVLIQQILGNLLSNAVKYSPDSEPIRVDVQREGADVVIAVTDRGPGISDADQTHIFERFRRLGDPLRRESGGAGLGLYIARQMAEAQGGRIEVASALGRGSTFILRLPAARPALTLYSREHPSAMRAG